MSGLTGRGRATRERIVAAASDLVYERGVARTSTQDVEAAAGVSSSQIYHYFADKPSLIRAVVAYQGERVVGGQELMLAGGGGEGMAALESWRDGILAMQERLGPEGGCPVGSLASELADGDPLAREDLVTVFARWESALHRVLAGMAERGELGPAADPGQLAIALLGAVQGGILLSKTRRDSRALQAGLDVALDHIRALVREPPASAS
jgi:TetR/AcrR family transcriptional repressor of nem operon